MHFLSIFKICIIFQKKRTSIEKSNLKKLLYFILFAFYSNFVIKKKTFLKTYLSYVFKKFDYFVHFDFAPNLHQFPEFALICVREKCQAQTAMKNFVDVLLLYLDRCHRMHRKRSKVF